MSSSRPSKDELLDIITSNNMIEDLVSWLREKKGIDTSNPISLKDLEYEILYEFVKEKGLLNSDNGIIEPSPSEFTHPEPEELGVDKRPTKPKKIRKKK